MREKTNDRQISESEWERDAGQQEKRGSRLLKSKKDAKGRTMVKEWKSSVYFVNDLSRSCHVSDQMPDFPAVLHNPAGKARALNMQRSVGFTRGANMIDFGSLN
jgi:hypothetical protein